MVLHINAAQAEAWTLREVVDRWHQLCKGSPHSQRFYSQRNLERCGTGSAGGDSHRMAGTADGYLLVYAGAQFLERLQIDPRYWLYLNRNFESRFKSLVGCALGAQRL
ncbi:hypothetical protein Q2E61_14215 [Microbulbifer thermotolerans]|uniref:hypothetical protein n=1 Tax=Microbulbifer thermotolerans TaxID=252514 RepID=UPI0026737E49|nr:hypothetical protein [Microbulbifer thermotolerans]WKT60048.1 hypothetical protein Q2E61_14215 [Microbulbifer thermotolerans]